MKGFVSDRKTEEDENKMKNNNYRTNMGKRIMGWMAAIALSASLLAGCGQSNRDAESVRDTVSIGEERTEAQRPESNAGTGDFSENGTDTENMENQTGGDQATESGGTQLEVRFGDSGEPFMMTLLDNETAAAVARYVGTSDWRLPIYERDADADYSVLQYYDIPSRYEIPSNSETVTEAKAGDVFYSDPNRIVLFYHDAEISAEYTKIGTFEATEEFITAVEENPVLEGWGNKIIQISQP